MAKSKHTIGKSKNVRAKAARIETKALSSDSKKERVIALMSRKSGASIEEMMAVTQWLPHSTRAVLSGFRKAGRDIARSKDDGGITRYHVA